MFALFSVDNYFLVGEFIDFRNQINCFRCYDCELVNRIKTNSL